MSVVNKYILPYNLNIQIRSTKYSILSRLLITQIKKNVIVRHLFVF